MMNDIVEKKEYWQSIRGICILAVVLIHSLAGFDYSINHTFELIVFRQVITFAVAIFMFMAGYFVNTDRMKHREKYLLSRGGAAVHSLCNLVIGI